MTMAILAAMRRHGKSAFVLLGASAVGIGWVVVSLPGTADGVNVPPSQIPAECANDAAPQPGNPPQHPAPCHGNPNGLADAAALLKRGDIASLPARLQDRLARLACRPHSTLPVQFYSEADSPSQLFQYYLLDTTGFEPDVFTARIPGVNDTAMFTATGANCGLPTIAAVRLVVEPKPGLPTDPDNPRAFVDVMTDLSGLFVINNESGWYEGWMIHDLRVAPISETAPFEAPQFGTITQADADFLAHMGSGNNVPGNYFTVDGNVPHFPRPTDLFPTRVPNIVPLHLSMGAYNALQQSDAHQYWEFNYTTNWIHPLWELPFTGGFPDDQPTEPADTYEDGELGQLASIVGGTRAGLNANPSLAIQLGDSPYLPRDPDKFDADDDAQREFRQRFIPSALAREIFLDVFERPVSFLPFVTSVEARLLLAYAQEIACVDTNGDGVISAEEGDIDTPSCGFSDNSRLYLLPRTFDRFAVTREINDGYLAPRFAPSTRGWVMSGNRVDVSPSVSASAGRDSDDR